MTPTQIRNSKRITPGSTRAKVYRFLLNNPSGVLGLTIADKDQSWSTNRASISKVLLDMVYDGIFVKRERGGVGEKNRPAYLYYPMTQGITVNHKGWWVHDTYHQAVECTEPVRPIGEVHTIVGIPNSGKTQRVPHIGQTIVMEMREEDVLERIGRIFRPAETVPDRAELRNNVVNLVDLRSPIHEVVKAYELFLES